MFEHYSFKGNSKTFCLIASNKKDHENYTHTDTQEPHTNISLGSAIQNDPWCGKWHDSANYCVNVQKENKNTPPTDLHQKMSLNCCGKKKV